MKAEGLPRRLRLRRRGEFLRVQRSGEKHHTRHFMVFVAPTPASSGQSSPEVGRAAATPVREAVTSDPAAPMLPPTRLGVTVTRKVGGAVVRNRIKRCVREAFRRSRKAFPHGLDMVWVAKRVAVGVDCATMLSEMDSVAGRLRRPSRSAPSSPSEASR